MITPDNYTTMADFQETANEMELFKHRHFCAMDSGGQLVSLKDGGDELKAIDIASDGTEDFVDYATAIFRLTQLASEGNAFTGLVFLDTKNGDKPTLMTEDGTLELLAEDGTSGKNSCAESAETLNLKSVSTEKVIANIAKTSTYVESSDTIVSVSTDEVNQKSNREGRHGDMPETALRKGIKNRPQANGDSFGGRSTSRGPQGTVHDYNTPTGVKNQPNYSGNQRFNLADVTREIKSRINVKDYAEQNGFCFRSVGDTYRSNSIMGGSNKTCLAIRKDNPDYFTDFKSGDSGDVFTFCALLHHDGEFYPALQELAELTGVELNGSANTEIFSKRAELPERVRYWNEALLESSGPLDYVKQRLGDKAVDTIKRLKLGWSEKRNRIMIPYLKGTRPVYFAGRYFGKVDRDHPKYYKAPTKDYGEQPCWGEDTLKRKGPLFLAEGAFDAMSFEQEGYSVLSLFGGNPSQHQRQIIRNAARAKAERGEDTILVFDADEAGKGFTRQMANDLFERHIPFKTAIVPDNLKDVSEYYEVHRSVDGILATAIDGLTYMVRSNVGNKVQFEKFAMRVCRNLSRPDIAALFGTVKGMDKFDKDWLKELERSCKSTPSEDLITNEVLETHDLIFLRGMGFFEYENDVWTPKTEEDIKGYARMRYGARTTDKGNKACHNLLQTKCNSHIELNRKWLMCFNNGTLDFETGELRNPRREDYMTAKAPYDYDPEATCPLFEKTVEELMGGDKDKIRLLKQAIGYVVVAPDNFLQKCPFWIGRGGNGKGVLLRAIEDALGTENVSHVGISQLVEPWGRIRIEHSRLNISSEEVRDLRGAEAVFKAATGGDIVDGNAKFETAVEFRPRANWIVSANSLPQMKDPSNALLRRMLFIRFGESYVDDPKGPHEHPIDPHLNDKLREELPGIFNWIYDGYKDLIANGERFALTGEHLEIMEDFKEALDPVSSFIEDRIHSIIDYNDEFDSRAAYKQYQDWCNSEGYRNPLNRDGFFKRFKDVFLELYSEEWQVRTNNHKPKGYMRKPGNGPKTPEPTKNTGPKAWQKTVYPPNDPLSYEPVN